MELTNQEFYYCYSPVLFKFLMARGHKYLCCGLAENTLKKFWQYQRTESLCNSLDEFRTNRPIIKSNVKNNTAIS